MHASCQDFFGQLTEKRVCVVATVLCSPRRHWTPAELLRILQHAGPEGLQIKPTRLKMQFVNGPIGRQTHQSSWTNTVGD